MVYGPGGYKAKDFFYLGGPLQIVFWILSVALLATTDVTNMYISWFAALAALLAAACISVVDVRACFRQSPSSEEKIYQPLVVAPLTPPQDHTLT